MCVNPENGENRELQEAKAAEEKAAGYSIFDNPANFEETKNDARKPRHPMLTKIIAGVLSVALLGGAAFAAVKLIPEKDDETDDGSISLLGVSANDVSAVEINLKSEKLILKSEIRESDDESTVFWTVDGVDEAYTDSSSISSAVKNMANAVALEKKAATEGEDYGFENSELTVSLTTAAGEKTVTFGEEAPANLGVYCKVSTDSENIYIVSMNTTLSFQLYATDFANTAAFGGYEITSKNNACFSSDKMIIDFDYFSLSGSALSGKLKVVPQADDAVNQYFAFKIVEPIERIGDNDNLQLILDVFAGGVTAGRAYSYESSPETLKEYGLDNPYLVAEMSLAGEKHILRFSSSDENGSCAMTVDDYPVIYMVQAANVGFYSLGITDYYSSFMVLENLSGLKALSIEVPNGTSYSFDLSYSADDDGSNAVYKAFFSGKELDIAEFKEYYQTIIGMSPISYESGSTSGVTMRIRFVHSGDLGDTVLSFRPYSAQRYQVDINGMPLGLLTKTVYDQFLENTKTISENGKIS